MFWFIINIIVMLWTGRDAIVAFNEGLNGWGWICLFISALNAASALSYIFS